MQVKLSKREEEVMALVVQGYGKKEIADKIFRSFHTVSMVYRNIYAKLGISKDTEMVREWFVLKYKLCRTDLNTALATPHLVALVFFFSLSVFQIMQEIPAFKTVRTAKTASTMRVSRVRRKDAGDADFLTPNVA